MRARNAEIRRQGQAQPAPHRRTLHGSDDWKCTREHPHRSLIQHAGLKLAPVIGPVCRQLGTCAEMLALRAQHDRAAAGAPIERLIGVRERRHQLDVEVVVRRPVDLDRGDEVLVHFDRHIP